jgi:molecular chaperone HtpG
MAADKVTMVTRRAGSKSAATRWESIGDGTYTIEECDKETRGTEVVLHLKEDMREFLDEWRIRSIVKKYSDYVQYPVAMDITREELPQGIDGKPIEGAEKIKKVEEETLNSMKAIWARPKSEITEEEYNEFYKHISHDYNNPFRTIHYAAEGISEFKALLYIPEQKPFDLFSHDHRKGVQLYVKRVFITDKCENLLPDYLRFVKCGRFQRPAAQRIPRNPPGRCANQEDSEESGRQDPRHPRRDEGKDPGRLPEIL